MLSIIWLFPFKLKCIILTKCFWGKQQHAWFCLMGVLLVHTASVLETNKKGKASDSDHLHAVLTLKASLPIARSENGFIHVWNLKTHRVYSALDGHGRKSVYCVETMGGKDKLLRLAKQAKTSELTLVSVTYSCFLTEGEKKWGQGCKVFS